MQSATRILRGKVSSNNIFKVQCLIYHQTIKAASRQSPVVRRAFQQTRFNSTVATEAPKKGYSKWKMVKNTAKLGTVGFVGYTFYCK